MQSTVWFITLACVALLAAVFYYVISNSKTPEEYPPIQKKWYSFRGKWFLFLAGLWVVVTFATLMPFPIAPQAQAYSGDGYQVVDVSGHQWYWTMSTDTVVAGKPVAFQVTGADVNHGLGIYDEDLTLVAQVQAMPGYTNKLIYTFDEPGKYRILCLEYCGLAHHAMIAELNVEAAS
ncbi:cytochrome c oxidase subunit II [Nitrosococcus halophilus Nc 4]|uniref:Cytochrome c oxidase subunit II n=1 Tax=Nitrosococcus halophilus (strain Nc4) TaxID=472759 RepID=D5BVH9_NITHN|nr:cytochrome c oxidase subunit II [Nitrosococcus halophilus]ADE13607.1 cytochrome c oxidase subunit II [Nitrosococcus halophilus Nc 4]